MHRLAHVSLILLRVAFGALFVHSGLNHLLHFWQPPAPTTEAARIFLVGLDASGFTWPLLGVVFVLAGAALILQRQRVPALLALAVPVLYIFGYHAWLEHAPMSIGTVVVAAYLLLAWTERDSLRTLLRARPPRAT